jgi:hypothetical protein
MLGVVAGMTFAILSPIALSIGIHQVVQLYRGLRSGRAA